VINGIPLRIVETTAACTYERVKTYPKRRAKNASHLRRMNNKWLRRYGMRGVPQAYMLGGETLVVHPMLALEYRRALKEVFRPGAVYPEDELLDNFIC
jgi:hypothetical protein